jgi:hypothetical protein
MFLIFHAKYFSVMDMHDDKGMTKVRQTQNEECTLARGSVVGTEIERLDRVGYFAPWIFTRGCS